MSLLSSNGGSGCSCDKEEEAERLCSFDLWLNLPNDLIIEILCRLPAKPLIRFKCVSKAWNFLISNNLVHKISPSSIPLSGLLFHKTILGFGSNLFMDYAPYPPPPPPPRHVRSCSALWHFNHTLYDLQDCCNGLLLFVLKSSVPAEYYVCNPLTKQRVAIPTNPTHLEPMFAALAFNPSESSNYKIVRVAQSAFVASISNPPKLDILSSDTGKWVTHAVPLDPVVYGFKWIMRGVYFKGVLYMLSSARYLVSFDIKTGNNNVSGGAIELPRKDRFDFKGCIGVSKGCFFYSNHDGSELCIWSLDGEWILRHRISLKRFVAVPPLGNRIYERHLDPQTKPCGFHPTCEMVFLLKPKILFSYHLQTKRLELLIDMRNAKNVHLGRNAAVFTYSHCLVLLNKISIPK